MGCYTLHLNYIRSILLPNPDNRDDKFILDRARDGSYLAKDIYNEILDNDEQVQNAD